MNEMPVSPEQPRRNNTLIIVVVVVVLLLCCCCIAAALLWQFGDCITNPNDPALCPLASTLISTI
ncbi:MAG TPA: hypothetical protein VIV15_08510 [Anaerolineales bacterium]